MSTKLDLKFVAGLLVGALAVGGIVAVLMGDHGDRAQNASRYGGPSSSGLDGGDGLEGGGDRGDGTDVNGHAGPVGPAPSVKVPGGPGKVACPAPTRTVGSARDLQSALDAAVPGDVIKLNPGTYQGKFMAQRSGTSGKPIFVCGDAQSIVDGGGIKKGYAFHLNKVSHWRLVGFSVQNSQKGVMADGSTDCVIQDLAVHDIGDEAIHLRNFSTGNTVQYNVIYNTGLRRAAFGEGVYLGTAESNWPRFSGGKMDKSDHNVVRGNVIRAAAEAIDIKEGTTGGQISGNVFDGSALSGSKHNDSWVDVKGNGYLLKGNTGSHTTMDGFQTHEIIKGWGSGNTFSGNIIDLGRSGGVGIKDTVGGNTVTCDNKVTGGPVDNRNSCS